MYFTHETVSYTLEWQQTESPEVRVNQMDIVYPQGPGKEGNKQIEKMTEAQH